MGTAAAALLAVESGSGSAGAVAVGANQFDATSSVYNWKASNTRQHRAGLGLAAAGSLAGEVFIGDSLTAGCIGGMSFDRLHAWPRVYSSTLAAAGIPSAGTGLVRLVDNITVDARWTSTGVWTPVGTCAYAGRAGASVTFTADVTGTVVAVAYERGPGGGPFTVSVDGATSGAGFRTVTGTGVAGAARVVLAGLDDSAHEVTVTTSSSSLVVIIGAEVSNAAGLACHNVAQSGSRAGGTGTSSWSDTTSGSGQPLSLFGTSSLAYGVQPSAVHCALGVNDALAGADPATTVAAITTIRQACAGSDFFLYLQPQPAEVDPAVWSAYGDAVYGLADALDVPLFDLQDRLGGYAIELENGLTGDAVAHLNRAGYAEWGRAAGLAAAR